VENLLINDSREQEIRKKKKTLLWELWIIIIDNITHHLLLLEKTKIVDVRWLDTQHGDNQWISQQSLERKDDISIKREWVAHLRKWRLKGCS